MKNYSFKSTSETRMMMIIITIIEEKEWEIYVENHMEAHKISQTTHGRNFVFG